MHTIRLRRPWRRTAGQDGAIENVSLPDLNPVASPSGSVLYERIFNCPTGLESGDRVCLVIGHLRASHVSVHLNAISLLDTAVDNVVLPLRLDLTEQLQPSNQLAIQLQSTSQTTVSLDGDVCLQIEAVG